MLTLLLIIFALTAILGAYLLSYVLGSKNTPKGIAMIHGFIGAMGILLLIIYSLLYQPVITSLILFILAAAGGLTLFFWDITGKKIPKFLALGHGLVALGGFIALIWFAFNHF